MLRFFSKIKFGFVISFICTAFFASIALGESTMPKAEYTTRVEIKQWKRAGVEFIFIDTREPFEFEIGHLKNAVNIPFSQIEDAASTLSKDKKYVIYCTLSSWRAPYAANTLKDMGFQNIYILKGGIQRWYEKGQIIYAANPNKNPGIAPYPKDLDKDLKHPPDKEYFEQMHLTLDELTKYNGQDGWPAYVAVNGVIYDLTNSRLWRGGMHDPSDGHAVAGRDLTDIFINQAPHDMENLKRFPIVGKIIESP